MGLIVSKLTKLLNYTILFFKNAYKRYNVKSFSALSKQLFEKIGVGGGGPRPPGRGAG
jgi:hypothetical protein